MFLTSIVAFNISREKLTKDLMATLSKMYEKPSASNNIFLMRKLFNLKMTDSESVVGHLNEFNTLTSQLESVEINLKMKSERWFYRPGLRWSCDGGSNNVLKSGFGPGAHNA